MTNYTKKAVKGVTIVLVISLLAAFLGYLVRMSLARILTVEDFGLFYAVFSFLCLIGSFKSLGLDQALVKFIPEFLHKKRKDHIKSSILYTTTAILITNLIVITAIYMLSNYLSINFFHSPRADIVLKLMAIAFFIDSFVLSLKYIFQSFQKMTYFAGIDLIRMLLILTIILIGLKLNYGILLPVFAYILTPLILLIVFSFILFKRIFPEFFKLKFFLDRKLFKKISKYGLFVISTSVGLIILGHTDTIVLTYFSGLTAVGLYNIALPTAKVLSYLPKSIAGVLLPLSAELWIKNKKAILVAGIESLYKYSIIIMVPAVLIMLSFTDLMIEVLFGKEYILASPALKILGIGIIFTSLYGVNSAFFSGIGKPQINSMIVYTAAAFNLVSNLILVPLMGILGAAITTTASCFIMMAIGLKKIKKFIEVKLPIKIWAKTLVAGGIFIFIIWFLKKIIFLNVWLETAIVLIISGIAYITVLFVFRVINTDELNDLYRRILK